MKYTWLSKLGNFGILIYNPIELKCLFSWLWVSNLLNGVNMLTIYYSTYVRVLWQVPCFYIHKWFSLYSLRRYGGRYGGSVSSRIDNTKMNSIYNSYNNFQYKNFSLSNSFHNLCTTISKERTVYRDSEITQ